MIVVSILLAFAIQAWWEQREDGELRTQALSTLTSELSLLEELLGTADQRDSIIASNAQYLISAIAQPDNRSSDSLSLAADYLSYTTTTDVELTAYDLLVNTGSLDVVANASLIEEIVLLRSVLSAKDRGEQGHLRFVEDQLKPYLIRHLDSNQVDRKEDWLEARGIPVAESRRFPVDWATVMADREFHNLVHSRMTRVAEMEEMRDRIRGHIARIREMTIAR